MMHTRAALVITSIAAPNQILQTYASECEKHGVHFILVGDRKSPSGFTLACCEFWSIEKQMQSDLRLARELPENHYARKNIGYLVAMKKGYDIIIETDDDNIPMDIFWSVRRIKRWAHSIRDEGWVNVYKYFSNQHIWPRGFALEHLQDAPEISQYGETRECLSPIQQGLADENPDVDAIYRLIFKLPIRFGGSTSIALGSRTWCPFNSQNTTWFREAFPLMYLPSYCSFRMTDIWRSFVAQRIAWECGWWITYDKPSVVQKRNEHDLIEDLVAEIPGYRNNRQISEELESLNLKKGLENIEENMLICYERLVSKNYLERRELNLLETWMKDVH